MSIRSLLFSLICRDDLAASTKLNEFVLQRVLEQISNPRISLNLASVVRPEIMLLTDSLKMEDSCWEQRLRTGQFMEAVASWGRGGVPAFGCQWGGGRVPSHFNVPVCFHLVTWHCCLCPLCTLFVQF